MNESDLVVTIVGQDIPNLKEEGACRDAKTILSRSPNSANVVPIISMRAIE